MNKNGVDQLTLRDVEAMSRPELLGNLKQISAFFPMNLEPTELARLTDDGLRKLLAQARRGFQRMGY